MIANICGASYTAYYSVAYSISSILSMLISSVNSSYIPWYYQKMAENDDASIARVSRMLLVAVGAFSLVPALLGPEVVAILGSRGYLEGIWVMPAVSIGVYFTFLYSLFSNYELFYESGKLLMVASIGAALLNVALNYMLLPVFGFVAAGYTTLICYIALAFFHYWGMCRVSKQMKGRTIPFDIRFTVLVSLVLLAASVGVTFLYYSTLVRYAVFICAVLVAFTKRTTLTKMFNDMKAR